MKLVTFSHHGQERIGAVMADGRILDFQAGDPRLGVDMLTLIREQDALMPLARALAAQGGASRCGFPQPSSDPASADFYHLSAPLPKVSPWKMRSPMPPQAGWRVGAPTPGITLGRLFSGCMAGRWGLRRTLLQALRATRRAVARG